MEIKEGFVILFIFCIWFFYSVRTQVFLEILGNNHIAVKMLPMEGISVVKKVLPSNNTSIAYNQGWFGWRGEKGVLETKIWEVTKSFSPKAPKFKRHSFWCYKRSGYRAFVSQKKPLTFLKAVNKNASKRTFKRNSIGDWLWIFENR